MQFKSAILKGVVGEGVLSTSYMDDMPYFMFF